MPLKLKVFLPVKKLKKLIPVLCLLSLYCFAWLLVIVLSSGGSPRSLSIGNLNSWILQAAKIESLNTDSLATSKKLDFQVENGPVIIEDGIFWSKEIESKIAPGISDKEALDLLMTLRSMKITKVQSGSKSRCGGHPDKIVTFENGLTACAKRKIKSPEFVPAELLSFYLARMLGLGNVPVVALIQVCVHCRSS